MVKPPIQEQIQDIDDAIKYYPEYREQLEYHRALLEIRRSIEERSEGRIYGDSGVHPIKNIQQMAHSTKKPFITFLDPSKFDSETVQNISKQITRFFADRRTGGDLEELFIGLDGGEIKASEPLESILREDARWFEDNAERFHVEPGLLLYIFSTSIQSFLEDITRRLDRSFFEQWWEANCPVCGRRPVVARIKRRKRYLSCVFCGADYLTDQFLCVNCGNKDPYTLGFLTPEGKSGFQVDFCVRCKNYLKVIDEDRLTKRIPRGLEDILTQRLDVTASEAGFRRT